MSSEQLRVIALISGGKDSFYSILHCLRNGHQVVALANLFPETSDGNGRDPRSETQIIEPDSPSPPSSTSDEQRDAGKRVQGGDEDDESDLNSFMYQTVGHQIIPLYAAATGLPLYRQPIRGDAAYQGRDYAEGIDQDETESMVPLLRAVVARHPEANAVCAGAILSSYQRTRVESVALRLGLTPLAYLWKYPVLPPPPQPTGPVDDAQLLLDMAEAGLEARIIKVASAGLDASCLWEVVSSTAGSARLKRSLKQFGTSEGSVLGEGGEFETLVLDGPDVLFKKRLVIPGGLRRLVHEGGGTSWLAFRGGQVEEKHLTEVGQQEQRPQLNVRVPGLLDSRFNFVQTRLSPDDANSQVTNDSTADAGFRDEPEKGRLARPLRLPDINLAQSEIYWTISEDGSTSGLSIEEETHHLVLRIRSLLENPTLPEPLTTEAITNAVIILRRMDDFPTVNRIYGNLFTRSNPPSRVTISCGDLLPSGCNISIQLTVRPGLPAHERKGLHVQSRSYWAPANIGPYSQAIDVPLLGSYLSPDPELQSPSAVARQARALSIAGQIPLWPASMIIPPDATIETQILLSLQHLWRIGTDQRVQVWSSAVAYFPRTSSAEEMRRKSRLAATAWRLSHTYTENPDGDDNDDDEADPWDRMYNAQSSAFGGAGDMGSRDLGPSLPDWSVMKNAVSGLGDADDEKNLLCVPPPFFAVEVEELPRQSGVEWHAHLGLANLEARSVEILSSSSSYDSASREGCRFAWQASHTYVSRVPVRSVVSITKEANDGDSTTFAIQELIEEAKNAYLSSLLSTDSHDANSWINASPYLVYVDSTQCSGGVPAVGGSAPGRATTCMVPCRSIWSGCGDRILGLAVFNCLAFRRRRGDE